MLAPAVGSGAPAGKEVTRFNVVPSSPSGPGPFPTGFQVLQGDATPVGVDRQARRARGKGKG